MSYGIAIKPYYGANVIVDSVNSLIEMIKESELITGKPGKKIICTDTSVSHDVQVVDDGVLIVDGSEVWEHSSLPNAMKAGRLVTTRL